MNGPEAPRMKPKEASPDSVLTEEEVKEFLAARNIQPESHDLIVELAKIPKDTLINGMHNFFSFNQGERAIPALNRSASLATTEDQKKMYELFSEFTTKNDPYAARHLVAVLERRGRNP